MKGSSALVSGGAGFIGSSLVERLLNEGVRVRILDDFSTGRRENLTGLLDRLELVEGSVTRPEDCVAACVGVDYVFHQAAIPSVHRSVADPFRTHEVGATGTMNLLVAAKAAAVRRFVYAGSSSAYGDTPTLPKREDMAERPLSPYAVAKLTGEHYARVFHRVYGLETVVLRYFNVFGPRQDPASQYSAAVPRFIRAALDGRAPLINGDGGQTRDFTYIDNVVQANLQAAQAPSAKVAGEVFNVAAGERTSINELWRLIQEIVGSSIEAQYGPGRPGDVRDSLADLTRARERFGYEVRVSLREGLERTAAALGAAGRMTRRIVPNPRPAPFSTAVESGNPRPLGRVSVRMRRPLLALALALAVGACKSAPPYQGMEAAELHSYARGKFEARDYNEVERALSRLFVAFPSYPATNEARLLLADSYFAHKQYITAEAEYRRFLDRFPGDPKAPLAGLGMCRSAVAQSPEIQRDQSPTEDAETTCKNIASDYPGKPEATEAGTLAEQMRLKLAQKLNAIGDYYLRRKFYESSIVYFEMVEKQYADTPWAPTSLLNIMKAYQKIGYQDLVAETRKKILDSYPSSPEARGLAADSATASAAARTGGER